MGTADQADQDVRAGEVFVECIKRKRFPGVGSPGGVELALAEPKDSYREKKYRRHPLRRINSWRPGCTI